jgi:hypothetical protein
LPAADPDLWSARRSDQPVVAAVEAAQVPATGGPGVGPYGLPADLFRRLWSIEDICAFCGVEKTKARQLMSTDGAPPKMRMASARCDRWNPVQVVTWLHGDDWRSAARSGQALTDAGAVAQDPRRFPGAAWAPEADA